MQPAGAVGRGFESLVQERIDGRLDGIPDRLSDRIPVPAQGNAMVALCGWLVPAPEGDTGRGAQPGQFPGGSVARRWGRSPPFRPGRGRSGRQHPEGAALPLAGFGIAFGCGHHLGREMSHLGGRVAGQPDTPPRVHGGGLGEDVAYRPGDPPARPRRFVAACGEGTQQLALVRGDHAEHQRSQVLLPHVRDAPVRIHGIAREGPRDGDAQASRVTPVLRADAQATPRVATPKEGTRARRLLQERIHGRRGYLRRVLGTRDDRVRFGPLEPSPRGVMEAVQRERLALGQDLQAVAGRCLVHVARRAKAQVTVARRVARRVAVDEGDLGGAPDADERSASENTKSRVPDGGGQGRVEAVDVQAEGVAARRPHGACHVERSAVAAPCLQLLVRRQALGQLPPGNGLVAAATGAATSVALLREHRPAPGDHQRPRQGKNALTGRVEEVKALGQCFLRASPRGFP